MYILFQNYTALYILNTEPLSVGINLTCTDLNYHVNINLSLLHLFIIIISIVLDYEYFQNIVVISTILKSTEISFDIFCIFSFT